MSTFSLGISKNAINYLKILAHLSTRRWTLIEHRINNNVK